MPITEEQLKSGEPFVNEGFRNTSYRLKDGISLERKHFGYDYHYLGVLAYVHQGTAMFYITIFDKNERVAIALSKLVMIQSTK